MIFHFTFQNSKLLSFFLVLNMIFISEVDAGQEEFFKDSDEFLEEQMQTEDDKLILGHRFGIGPKLLVIQSEPEVSAQAYYYYDLNEDFSLGLQGFSWTEGFNNFAIGTTIAYGQAYNQWGNSAFRMWLLNENIDEVKFNPRQAKGREFDWAISVVYMKELIPWRKFEYFPRFELELGYRQQDFLRRTQYTVQLAHLWVSIGLSVNWYLPSESYIAD